MKCTEWRVLIVCRQAMYRCSEGYWRHDLLPGLPCWKCPEGGVCQVRSVSVPSMMVPCKSLKGDILPAACSGQVEFAIPKGGILGSHSGQRNQWFELGVPQDRRPAMGIQRHKYPLRS
jgi:hypothetical protein